MFVCLFSKKSHGATFHEFIQEKLPNLEDWICGICLERAGSAHICYTGGHVPVHNAFEIGEVLLNNTTQPGSRQNASQSLISLACQGSDSCVIL